MFFQVLISSFKRIVIPNSKSSPSVTSDRKTVPEPLTAKDGRGGGDGGEDGDGDSIFMHVCHKWTCTPPNPPSAAYILHEL